MKIMILLRGACVRESVFNDTHRKVTNTGGCVLLFKDRKCRGGTCTAQLRLPAPPADSHSDGLQLCCVCLCACVGGRERGWDDGLIGTSTCSAYKSQVHSGRCKSQRMKRPPWLLPTVPHGRWVLVFLVIVHRQSRDWNCPSMYRSVRPVTGLSSGAEHQGQTRRTDFAAYSWRKITIHWSKLFKCQWWHAGRNRAGCGCLSGPAFTSLLPCSGAALPTSSWDRWCRQAYQRPPQPTAPALWQKDPFQGTRHNALLSTARLWGNTQSACLCSWQEGRRRSGETARPQPVSSRVWQGQ